MSIAVKIVFEGEIRRLSFLESSLEGLTFAEFASTIQKILPAFSPEIHVFQYQDTEGDEVLVTSTVELTEALSLARTKSLPVKFTVVAKPKGMPTVNLPRSPSIPVQNQNPQMPVNFEQTIQLLLEKIQSLAKNAEKNILPLVNSTIQPALQQAKNFSVEQYSNIASAVSAATQDMKDPIADFVKSVAQQIEVSRPVHKAWCNNCKTQIEGVRYKCGNCADYDLCAACESRRAHIPEHVFLKIYTPITFTEIKPLLPSLYELAEIKPAETQPVETKPAETKPVEVIPPVPSPVKVSNNNASEPLAVKPQSKSSFIIDREPVAPFDSSFVTDETVKDGTVFAPSTPFVKIWVMQNTGSQNWVEGTKLVLVAGNSLGTKGEIAVRPAVVGEKIDIFAEMVAPNVPGRYSSHWRLASPDGRKFGHRIWVEIVVEIPKVEAPKPEVKVPEVPKPIEVVKPVAPAPSEVELKFASTLTSLAELGFKDKEKNLELIKKFNGDLVQIVTALLDQ